MEDIRKEVVKKFPESKFNSAHLAWYRFQVNDGNFKLAKGMLKKVGGGESK